MRRRTIQKYGNSYAIKLEPSDMKDFELIEGDIVDIDDLNLFEIKKKEVKK
jgi:antitoxin component of MazEF toxin-antitoxin module